ncbi:tetratricopeptide repeat protein [Lysobacter alkalisoli]|uniref:Tetratricopeptide repeat protein n=1 Tax=Marilutibacter alkalisoli TaxID=2591633 RepID=A0A514BWH9_9GAMM|nr:tetratricopeptide repeat protein [Lysobacter alkalisoli]
MGVLRRAAPSHRSHQRNRRHAGIGDRAQPRSPRRAAPVHPCSRSLRRARTWRCRRRPPARPGARLRPPCAHARAHLRPGRPLARRGHRQPARDRSRRCLSRRLRYQRQRRLPARLRAPQPSLPVVRREHGRCQRHRPRGRGFHRRTHHPIRVDARTRLRGHAALLADAAVRPRTLRPLGGDPRIREPGPDLPYVTAIWHYAQGTAAAREGRDDDARAHLASLQPLAADPVMEQMMVWERYPLAHAARIAERSLAAEIALAAKDHDAAIIALREAVVIEDAIPYDEPPGWHAPTRHALGAALLDAGRAGEAEAVYREELRRNPGNGWSLYGLARSLEAEGRNDEAQRVDGDFGLAWANADVKLPASRF